MCSCKAITRIDKKKKEASWLKLESEEEQAALREFQNRTNKRRHRGVIDSVCVAVKLTLYSSHGEVWKNPLQADYNTKG